VNYVDFTLVSLADQTRRASVFDQVSLDQLLHTVYDADTMGASGPYQPVFDDLQLGLAAPALGTLEGTWQPTGSPERTEVVLRVAGLGDSAVPRIDAFWRGAIVARYAQAGDPITSVGTAWPDADSIDAAIAAAHGGTLPGDPAALETERRTRFAAHVRTALDQPDVFTDDALDAWLADVGAGSLGDLFANGGTAALGTVKITYAPPHAVSESPKQLPVAAALLVRDAAAFSLAGLLADSRTIAERIAPLGLERPDDPTLRLRRPVVVVWVLPSSVFDDADWPGGSAGGLTAAQRRTLRRAAAGTWLAAAGIGLVVTSPH
jgi:hypothetical protein